MKRIHAICYVSVTFYILIVLRVREQRVKSFLWCGNRGNADSKPKFRPRSQSGPTFSSMGPFFNAKKEQQEKRRCVSTTAAPTILEENRVAETMEEEAKAKEELEMQLRRRR